jgi:tetratricopeptide (TPR) repeat protein
MEKPAAKTAEEPVPEKGNLLGMAKYLEKQGDLKNAAKWYERLIKKFPVKEYSYNRLMMIYRKQKDHANEFRVINAGIKAFEAFYTPSAIGKDKTIIALSKKLNHLTGLTDKKGRHLFDAEPLGKWKKRRELVKRKLG